MNEQLLKERVVMALTALYENRISSGAATAADDNSYSAATFIINNSNSDAWVNEARRQGVEEIYIRELKADQLNG